MTAIREINRTDKHTSKLIRQLWKDYSGSRYKPS